MQIDVVFSIIILLLSVVVHEVAHGYAALALGDSTAKYQGRLTLNPLRHIDPFGSVLLPLLLVITNAGFVFGWAKPVPFNPYNLRNQRWGEALVAAAGPASNIFLAIFFGILLRLSVIYPVFPASFIEISSYVVLINIVLAVFNVVPIPPLDGSKILFSLLPGRLMRFRQSLERYGLILAIIFIIFIWQYFVPVVFLLFRFVAGIPG